MKDFMNWHTFQEMYTNHVAIGHLWNRLNEYFADKVVIKKGNTPHRYAKEISELLFDSSLVYYAKQGDKVFPVNSLNLAEFFDQYECGCTLHRKNPEVVYEYKFSFTLHGVKLITNEFMTEEEASKYDTPFVKEESTKQVRVQS